MDIPLAATVVLVGSTTLAALLVPLSRVLARRFGIVDHPGERKIHGKPMPRLGGIAVFFAFIATVTAGYLLLPVFEQIPAIQDRFGQSLALLREAGRVQTKLIALMAGSSIAFGIGLVDDVVGIRFPAAAKAGGQLLAALVLIVADVRTSFLPYDWMNILLTAVWLVGMTNAFNLLDNMDGLSAGVAFVAASVLLLNAWSLGEYFIGLLLVAFIGSLLGFLFFNFHPASVFLGDCGSLFIGFVMGSLTLLERYVSRASSSLFPVLMPVLVLAIPIVDTATVVFIRVKERRPIYVGDSRHLSHRLLSLGFTQRATVLFMYLATFCLGLGAASLSDATLGQSLLILMQSAGFVALMLILMFFERRRQPRSVSG
jgi:UDP-GlcNAc:undecaprenyl-phosphate/decaprenyl-phosphate GlcNAc-1-phosphate transferase